MTRVPNLVAGLTLAGLLLALPATSGVAHAQLQDDLIPTQHTFVSPERMTLELRAGAYNPEMNDSDAFKTFFDDDVGPLLALELGVIGYRLEDILYLSGAGTLGWAKYSSKTLLQDGEASDEDTDFELVPLNLMAVVRVDVLPRKFSIPFIVTGKLGYQWMYWTTSAGDIGDESGWSVGLIYAVQFALDLDTFQPAKARILDEEWGINHSFVFLELLEFSPSKQSLKIGDFTWSAGLGFVF